MIMWLIVVIGGGFLTYYLLREYFTADNIFHLTDDEIRMGEEQRLREIWTYDDVKRRVG